jgi:hypothetical protein
VEEEKWGWRSSLEGNDIRRRRNTKSLVHYELFRNLIPPISYFDLVKNPTYEQYVQNLFNLR